MHKVIKSETKFKGRVFEACVEDIIQPNGMEVNREVVIHKGGCSMIAIKDHSTNNPSIVLVKQYRHAAKDFAIEIPAGILETGESPAEGATRELEEETGYKAIDPKPLFTMYKSIGYSTEKHYLNLCYVEGEPGKQNLDADEDVEVMLVTVDEAVKMIFDGRIVDAKTVAGILAYREMCR